MELEFVSVDSKPTTKSIITDLESIGSFGGVKASTKGKIKLGETTPKKKDKKKKNKKKEKVKESSGIDFTLISSSDNPEEITIDIDLDLEQAMEDMFDEEGNPILDPIIDEQKKGYGKRKKDKNPFKQEFAEEMTILYNLYSEVSDLTKDLEKMVKGTQNSKVRGTSKTFVETLNSLISAQSTKLQIVKEMSSVKKVMEELKFKHDAKNSKSDESTNTNLLASSYIQQVLNAGRNNFIQKVRGTTEPGFLVDSYSSGDEDDEARTLMDFKGVVPGYTDDEELDMNHFLIDRLEEEENPFRSAAGNKLIQYEKQGVKVCIQKDLATGDWNFIAVDRDNQVVHDYPLPQNPGKIKWVGNSATDRYGVTYRVIDYDSGAFPEDED